MKLRLFIGIALSEHLKNQLQNLIIELKNISKLYSFQDSLRWIAKEKLHITLEFLGEIEAERIAVINKILLDISKQKKPIAFEIDDFLLLPSKNCPRILAAKIPPNKSLEQLQAAVRNKLREQSFNVENRAFTPHITLARIKKVFPKSINDYLNFKHTFHSSVNNLTLFESQLSRHSKQSLYIPLKTFYLKNEN